MRNKLEFLSVASLMVLGLCAVFYSLYLVSNLTKIISAALTT